MGTDKKSHKYSSIEEQDFFASKRHFNTCKTLKPSKTA